MGTNSGIQWTTHTFNPWHGCVPVSEACKNCYAEVSTPIRVKRAKGLEVWGPASTTPRDRTSAANWGDPRRWNRAALKAGRRDRVFCASLADVFEAHPMLDGWRTDLWKLIEECTSLDWQLLTKRPGNIRAMVPPSWLESWPAHVWVGTTVESQARAEERIPHLLAVPAKVRFLSCEPLLGPLDLTRIPYAGATLNALTGHVAGPDDMTPERLQWVIVGGESGTSARPFDLRWARSIVAQCKAAAVPVFVKQLGARPVDFARAPEHQVILLRDGHGGDMEEWPADLRVRELPRGAK
jgi:protein gp37